MVNFSIIQKSQLEEASKLDAEYYQPKFTQQKIADLVRKSHECRQKSKELLEKAKRKVEEMIEN